MSFHSVTGSHYGIYREHAPPAKSASQKRRNRQSRRSFSLWILAHDKASSSLNSVSLFRCCCPTGKPIAEHATLLCTHKRTQPPRTIRWPFAPADGAPEIQPQIR